MSKLIFDIETIPDIELAKAVYPKIFAEHEGLTDHEIFYKKVFEDKFPPVAFHRIICIAAIQISDPDVCKLYVYPEYTKNGIVDDVYNEKSCLEGIIKLIETLKPTLISWNGINFDIPAIQTRALKYQLQAPWLMDRGDRYKDKKWNNYRNRYHSEHIDLMDVIPNSSSNRMSLDTVSRLIGLPGKTGIGGENVLDAYQNEKFAEIGEYCILDVINTAFIWFRYRTLTGGNDPLCNTKGLENKWRDIVETTVTTRLPKFEVIKNYFAALKNIS